MTSNPLFIARLSVAALFAGVAAVPLIAPGQDELAGQPEGMPRGYRLREKDTSPDGRYGVLHADEKAIHQDKARNYLVALKPVKVLAENVGEAYSDPDDQHGGMVVDWAKDSKAALVLAGHKWGTVGATLFELREGKVTRRTDLRSAVDRALKAEMPEDMREVERWALMIDGEDDWKFSDDGKEIRIAVDVNTAPNLAPGLNWGGTLRGIWSVPQARWLKLKKTGKAYYNYDDTDHRLMEYLKSRSDDDLGKRIEGVSLPDDKVALTGHTLLHRIVLPAKRGHVYVLRKGSLAMGLPVAFTWVEPDGAWIPRAETPAGEWREWALCEGEVYTDGAINPGTGFVEICCPTEKWIKSLQPRAKSARWGVESMATIEDPDGFSNVRDEKGEVIATVKAGEKFLAVKPFAESAHWEAWLPDGVVGLIHESRVRLLPKEPLMKMNFTPCLAVWKEAAAQREAESLAAVEKPHPDNYYPTLLRALEGDLPALSRFIFSQMEDVKADGYVRDAWRVLHLVGDARFAEMLKTQPPEDHDVTAMLTEEWTTTPISDGRKYLKRHFPLTSAALFDK